MRILYILIILIAIFQSSFFPANLVLAFLIAKSYTRPDSNDYLLALTGGLTNGLLQGSNIGITTLLLVISVFTTHLYRQTPFSANLLFFIPYAFMVILVLNIFQAVFALALIDWLVIGVESILSVLIFALIRALGLIGRESHHLKLKI